MASCFFLCCGLLVAVFSRTWVNVNAHFMVGGKYAEIGQFPHQISLQFDNGNHICGGSIVGERYILTAGQCVTREGTNDKFSRSDLRVRVGSVHYYEHGKLEEVERIILHDKYDPKSLSNNIALIKLKSPLQWAYDIQKISLATEELPNGADVLISGWGSFNLKKPIEEHVRWTTLTAVTIEKSACTSMHVRGRKNMIYLTNESGKGACHGDSGGPVTYNDRLVGIVPFVYPSGQCGNANPASYEDDDDSIHHSASYISVLFYRQWILSKIAP